MWDCKKTIALSLVIFSIAIGIPMIGAIILLCFPEFITVAPWIILGLSFTFFGIALSVPMIVSIIEKVCQKCNRYSVLHGYAKNGTIVESTEILNGVFNVNLTTPEGSKIVSIKEREKTEEKKKDNFNVEVESIDLFTDKALFQK